MVVEKLLTAAFYLTLCKQCHRHI